MGACIAEKQSSFDKDLAFSLSRKHNALWREAAKEYFKDPKITVLETNPLHETSDLGIDLLVIVPSLDKEYKVDTKFHKANGMTWADDKVYLEYKHTYPDGTFKKVGWIEEEGRKTDYLFYAKEENQVVFVIPFPELQRAWRENKDTWLAENKSIDTPNYDKEDNHIYTSHCLLVPAEEIYKAIKKNFTVKIEDDRFWL